MINTYTEPVSKLPALGEIDWEEWDDYSEFGFTKEHVPELIRLGTDNNFSFRKRTHARKTERENNIMKQPENCE